jgi:tol-pal system protein YbgF
MIPDVLSLYSGRLQSENKMKNVKKVISVVVCIGTLLLFAGCSSTSGIRRTPAQTVLPEIDVVQVKENSEEALKLAQETRLDVDVLNTRVTEMNNRLISLSEDMSNISQAKIEELETRLALFVEAFKDLQSQVNALRNASQQVKNTKPSSSGTGPTFSPSTASSIIPDSHEYDTYQNALKVFNAHNYDGAIKLFAEIMAEYPDGTYFDNCCYWSGECSYALKDYSGAIISFKKVFNTRNSSKADDAQLKIGMCYLKMGRSDLAATEFRNLIDRYPSSEYVPRAKKYLSEIK